MSTTDLSGLLRTAGPSLSTELIDRWVSDGVTAAAARQRLARGLADGFGEIVRLAGLRFQHNARFVYLEDQYGDQRFWEALERVFRLHAPSYWGAVGGLRSRGGIVPRALFGAVVGAPLSRKRQLSPDRVLERLVAINLLAEVTELDERAYVRFKPHHYSVDPFASTRAYLLAEQVALAGVRNWLRGIGFASYEQIRIRGDEKNPEVAGLEWDLSGPSYMRPLVAKSEKGARPGFIVADINLRGVLDEHAVGNFVRKHDLAAAPAGVAPIMPFLIASGFTTPAFSLVKQKGVIGTTVAHLLGEDVAKALRDLISILTDMGATAMVNPEHVEQVFRSLTRIQGASGNLIGPLLELAVGYLVKEVEGGSIEIGKRVRDIESGRSADIDVMVIRPDAGGVLAIECKAKMPGSVLGLDVVQKWLSDRVPVMHAGLRWENRFAERPLRFELWTNGPMAPMAREWLQSVSRRSHPDYEIAWRDGAALKRYASKAKSAAITKIFNEHFFRHPLVATARQQPASSGADQEVPK